MKKLVAVLLTLAIMLPMIALADQDLTAMSDQELQDLIAACSAELRTRHTVEPDGILLFDAGGMRLYQAGDAYIDFSGYLRIPVTICNDRDTRSAISLKDTLCNGWDISGIGGYETKPHSKKKGDLTFVVADADVSEISQIDSLRFRWSVFDMETVRTTYEQNEVEEHRFW